MPRLIGKCYTLLFCPKTATLWHPDSPGEKVKVIRTWIGRIFKPAAFATLGECVKAGIEWEEMYDHIQCPVCGYYCIGKGGRHCIDKPTITGVHDR